MASASATSGGSGGAARDSSRRIACWICCFDGPAAAGQEAFDLRGGIVLDGHVGFGGGQADHAAGVAHQNRRAGPLVVAVQFLDRHHLGRERADHVPDAFVDLGEACFERTASSAPHDSRFTDHRARRHRVPARRSRSC